MAQNNCNTFLHSLKNCHFHKKKVEVYNGKNFTTFNTRLSLKFDWGCSVAWICGNDFFRGFQNRANILFNLIRYCSSSRPGSKNIDMNGMIACSWGWFDDLLALTRHFLIVFICLTWGFIYQKVTATKPQFGGDDDDDVSLKELLF